jgi:drug/metabolite transporter (DMT)-like permease
LKALSGKWQLGLTLTVLSILLWGSQPIAIAMIKSIPYSTLAFYKLFSATALVAGFLAIRGDSPKMAALNRQVLLVIGVAALSLSASYVAFNSSFAYISPSNVQVYFQLSRILFALGGIFIFKESFNRVQWAGLSAVGLGLYFFFQSQLIQNHDGNLYFLGVSIVIASAATWAIYALLQKGLLTRLSPVQALMMIYLLSTCFLFPYADAAPLGKIGAQEWMALIFICLSNVLAFVCFSVSLKHWETSKIGAMTCLTPIVTMFMMSLVSGPWQLVQPESFGLSSLLGAALSIAGSIMVVSYE